MSEPSHPGISIVCPQCNEKIALDTPTTEQVAMLRDAKKELQKKKCGYCHQIVEGDLETCPSCTHLLPGHTIAEVEAARREIFPPGQHHALLTANEALQVETTRADLNAEAAKNAQAELDRVKVELRDVNRVAFQWQEATKELQLRAEKWERVAKDFEQKMRERNEWGRGWKEKAETAEKRLDETTNRAISAASRLRELLQTAWGIIANASGGDWTKESADWQEAAAKWRDEYHASLK